MSLITEYGVILDTVLLRLVAVIRHLASAAIINLVSVFSLRSSKLRPFPNEMKEKWRKIKSGGGDRVVS
jgi:hypothetical protein